MSALCPRYLRRGEHTREVLIELLGYTSDEADALARGGVV